MDISTANSTSLRLLNLNKVLNQVYAAGSLTQAKIKEKSHLSGPTAIQCIQFFKEKGIFYEGKALASSGGRKPTLICFNYNYRYAVGIEVRSHHIDVAIVNLKGECVILKTVRLPFEQSSAYLKEVSRIVDELIEENIEKEKVIGICVAFPGEISLDKSRITRSTIFGMHDVSISNLKNYFHYPVQVEYGPNAASFGAAFKDRSLIDAVYVVVTDNGIAGSVVINKKIYRGNSGKAGAFGHIQLDSKGELCSCGRRGCWSACCSVTALTGEEEGNLKDFFVRVENGDRKASEALNRYIRNMAQGIANVHLAFDTDVIIGGKIVPYLDKYKDKLIEEVFSYPVLKEERFDIRLDMTSSSPMSEGAAAMLVENYLEEEIFVER